MLRFLAAILLSAVPFSMGHAQPSAAGGTAAAGSTDAPSCVWSSRSFGLNAPVLRGAERCPAVCRGRQMGGDSGIHFRRECQAVRKFPRHGPEVVRPGGPPAGYVLD
jgi:hypothetical protein